MIEKLKELNILNEFEYKIYSSLLYDGPGYIHEITRRTLVNRSTVVVTLQNLEKRGLIKTSKERKRPFYFLVPPDKIHHLFDQQINEIKSKQIEFQSLLPELKNLFNLQLFDTETEFFQGLDEVKNAHLHLLDKKHPIKYYTFKDFKKTALKDFWSNEYKPRTQKYKIPVQAIGYSSELNGPQPVGYLKYDDYTEALAIMTDEAAGVQKHICDDVILYTFIKKEELMAFLIRNKNLAHSESIMFDAIWKTFKKVSVPYQR